MVEFVLEINRLDLELVQRQLFNFRFIGNRKLKISEPEVENMLDEKRLQLGNVGLSYISDISIRRGTRVS